MTLFPAGVDKKYALSGTSEPKTEVNLEVYVEILKEVDKLELDYDKAIFDISEINLTNKAPSAKAKLSSTITLKCKKEFSSKEEIKVWAYPKAVATGEATPATTSSHTSPAPKFLAGKLTVYPNASNKRKKMKVALVSVETDWLDHKRPSIYQKGVFSDTSALDNLQTILNQSMIECTILKKPKDDTEIPDSDIFKDYFTLDLTSNPNYKYEYDFVDFSQASTPITKRAGKYIYRPLPAPTNGGRIGLFTTTIYDSTGKVIGLPNLELYNDLKTLFHTKYPNYQDCYLIFSFGRSLQSNADVLGQGEGIGSTSAILLDGHRTHNGVIAHEMLHVFGLPHSFRDIKDSEMALPLVDKQRSAPLVLSQEYVFNKYDTDNVMDYVSASDMKSTWAWQWERMNLNLKS